MMFQHFLPLDLAVDAVDTGIRLEGRSDTSDSKWYVGVRPAFSDGLLSKALVFSLVARAQYPRILQREAYVFMIQLSVLFLAVFVTIVLRVPQLFLGSF